MSWGHFHPKVTAGVFASYVSVVSIYTGAYFGLHIDGILGSAIDGILTTVFAYMMPSDDTPLTAENLRAILGPIPTVVAPTPLVPGDSPHA